MKEVFIIYDKTDGEIQHAARIDRDLDAINPNSSTALQQIRRILASNSNFDVMYLPNQVLPDPEQYKVEADQVVRKTPPELNKIRQKRIYEDMIGKEMRRLAIESLKQQGKIPQDYNG
ncbi:MAG: hypothetical protein GWN61_09610 [candidate division Zixibacteria bacterium]|nr:hypothetical protein [Phycisphaerae bacterium]NIR64341.1 hypothetical protein [candidate division Zixibacteria bacterium]NIW45239.1 hypothetical protein [Gammaproteobacteria bacterium]NIS46266.1 hypothetical protein [candidate division Zixibacteria bacterium]NIS54406.1 hypothetical protein [Phycisphaerae bacterium]